MEFTNQYITPDIKLSLYQGKIFKTDVVFEHHMLVWLIAGESKIVLRDRSQVFGRGDAFFIPRNQLATVLIYAAGDTAHQAVAMHLTPKILHDYYLRHPASGPLSAKSEVRLFRKHPLLQSCLASLVPYFDLQDALPETIASLKIEEAISILRSIDPGIDGLLANFDEPGKINLADFMEQHYMFNLPMERFGYLTGRSIATFRRDFKKAFRTTPQKWLTERRLELAHQQIAGGQRKPADVYFEVGFENLSHFSHAFKKQFGYTPTQLRLE